LGGLLSRTKLTIDSVYETLKPPIFKTGDVTLRRPQSLRVPSSEAVANSFPTSTDLLPHPRGT